MPILHTTEEYRRFTGWFTSTILTISRTLMYAATGPPAGVLSRTIANIELPLSFYDFAYLPLVIYIHAITGRLKTHTWMINNCLARICQHIRVNNANKQLMSVHASRYRVTVGVLRRARAVASHALVEIISLGLLFSAAVPFYIGHYYFSIYYAEWQCRCARSRIMHTRIPPSFSRRKMLAAGRAAFFLTAISGFDRRRRRRDDLSAALASPGEQVIFIYELITTDFDDRYMSLLGADKGFLSID